MSFADTVKNLFRPSWKHSDPERRADAVRQLDDDNLRALGEVAKSDPDPRIRRLAIKKIGDPVLLSAVAGVETDEVLRRAAADKADELLVSAAIGSDRAGAEKALALVTGGRSLVEIVRRAALDPVRRAALQRISDERGLADVARGADQPELRRLAIGRIVDGNVLRDLAIHEPLKEVGLVAVEKIAETAALEAVARRAKNRSVRDAARERLPQGMGKVQLVDPSSATGGKRTVEPSPAARLAARRSQLCREADQAVALPEIADAEAALAPIRAEWATLPVEPGDAQKRFDRALARLELKKKALLDVQRQAEEQEAEKQRREAAEAADSAARLAIIEKAEALEDEGLREKVEALREEWQGLGRAASAELFARFKKATDAALKRADLAISVVKLRERMAAVAAEADTIGLEGAPIKESEISLRAVQKKWRELEAAGADDALKARITAAGERVEALKTAEQARKSALDEEAAARLGELCARIEALADTNDRKAAEDELKTVQAAFQSVEGRGPKVGEARDRFTKAREKLQARLQEIRDADNWKRWANVPKLEKLCERMEALKTLDDLKSAAAQMKILQVEWKQVGPAPKERSEALWQRFKGAGDEVYKRTHEGFEKLDAERVANLQKKQELVARAEALVAAYFGRAATAGEAAAPAEAAGTTEAPAPASTEAVAAVEAKAEAPPSEATPTEAAPSEAVTTEATATEATATEATATEAATAEGATTEAAPAAPPATEAGATGPVGGGDLGKATAEALKALQEEWKKIGQAPRAENDAIWKRFRDTCDQFFGKRKERARTDGEARPARADRPDRPKRGEGGKRPEGQKREEDPAVVEKRNEESARRAAERAENLKQLVALCERVEAIVAETEAGAGRPGVQPKWREAADEIKAIQADWKTIGPAPRSESEAIWKRFRETCDRFFERRKQTFDRADEERLGNLKKKEALCERAEQLAALEDREEAMKEAKALQGEWKRVGQAPREQADAIWRRFRAACDKVFDRERRDTGGSTEELKLTPEEKAAIEAYGKFENKLPIQKVLEKLQPARAAKAPKAAEPAAPTETAPVGSASTEAAPTPSEASATPAEAHAHAADASAPADEAPPSTDAN